MSRAGDGGGWEVLHLRGTAGGLHARALPDEPAAAAWFLHATSPAVVLGSAEPDDHVDVGRLAAAGIDVARRRSGGGAVLVVPDRCTWLDLIVPAGHPLWDADVGRAMHWVGQLWSDALAEVGVETQVHRGPMRRAPWSRHVCFAGVGPGEVLDAAGRKVVGISQRRTRDAARFQSVAYHGAPLSAIASWLELDGASRHELASELDATTASVSATPDEVVRALVEHLPRT